MTIRKILFVVVSIFILYFLSAFQQKVHSQTCYSGNNGTGQCVYSNLNSPPNWTTSSNSYCATIFGWGCPDFTCQNYYYQSYDVGSIGSCSNGNGARVRCCKQFSDCVKSGGQCSCQDPSNGYATDSTCYYDAQWACQWTPVCIPAAVSYSDCVNNLGYCYDPEFARTKSCRNGYGDSNLSCNDPSYQCCQHDCNTTASWSSWSAPYNTCYYNNATRSGNYTQYNNAQNITCTAVSAGTQTGTINNCDGNNAYYCSNGSCIRNCTTGTAPGSCSACGGGSQPTNTCNLNGTNPGSQTCRHDSYYGSACQVQTNFNQACTYSYNNCSGAYTCTNNNSCQTSVSGNIWKDYDHSGADNSEPGFAGVTVRISSGASTTTDANGNYTFTGLTQGVYSVSYDVPAGYRGTTTTPVSVNLTSTLGARITNVNFGITPLYTITGAVYDDVNINKYYNAGVDSIHNGDSVTISGNGYNQTIGAGSFSTGQNLLSGEYHIVYNGPPVGWKIVYPGPPAELYVRVGLPGSSDTNHVCSNETYHDATCDASGNISGANVGVTNENSWVQGVCTDVRIDGTITNNGATSTGFIDPIPQTPGSGTTCGGAASNGTNDSSYAIGQGTINVSGGGSLTCTNPGIVFSGNTVPSFGFGQASKDPYNWSLGGGSPLTESFTPVNPTIIRTSYAYMTTTAKESGIDLTTAAHNIAPFCTGGLNSCTLSSALPNNVYLAQADLYLNSYSFPTSKNIVIIVNGDLHIEGNITVPVGATTTFSVSGNIYVDPTVGTTPTDTTPNIEGMFSADKSFIIQSTSTYGSACNADGTPKDLRLNVQGAVVTNAGGSGGGFVNQRDLCVSDLACPTYQITQRPDFLLNAPDFIKHKNFVWQEQAP